MFIVMMSEAKLKFLKNFRLPQNAVIDYLFPKDPKLVRVRNLEQNKIVNNGTILDFVSITKHIFVAFFILLGCSLRRCGVFKKIDHLDRRILLI